MSLAYNGTEGHNAAPASRDRATRRATDGTASRVQALILRDLERYSPTTCHEAEARIGVSHESYTGARTNLHRTGQVVRLAERFENRHLYVLPGREGNAEVVPFRSNRRAAPVPAEVAAAAGRIETWAAMSEGSGMLVSAPDFDDLRTVTAYLHNPNQTAR